MLKLRLLDGAKSLALELTTYLNDRLGVIAYVVCNGGREVYLPGTGPSYEEPQETREECGYPECGVSKTAHLQNIRHLKQQLNTCVN